MVFYRLSLLLACAAAALAQTPATRIATIDVGSMIEDWHQAASDADEPRYFSHFAPNGVFMGTDAAERWTVPEFRVWAKPYFDKKKAWSFRAHDRHIDFSADGATAWFDELLDTPNLGPCRGSGVVVRIGGEWKIAQYNLSIPIPNALAASVVKQIAAAK